MAHGKHSQGNTVKKAEKREKQFERLALAEARRSLRKAIEWVDAEDVTWALVMVQRAMAMLEAAKLT